MARLFDDGSSEYLSRTDTCGISDYPVSMACWFNSDVTINQALMILGDTDVMIYHNLLLRDPPDNDILCHSYVGSSALAKTSGSYSANTWHHACGVWAGAQDRRVYIDGGSKGTNIVDSKVFSTVDNTSIGCRITNNGTSLFISGMIAEAAIWNGVLTDADAVILAAGYSPLFVQPQNLVAYWSLVRGLNDKISGYNMTATGTIVAPHPRVIYPSGIWTPTGEVVTPPVGMAGAMTTNSGYWGY